MFQIGHGSVYNACSYTYDYAIPACSVSSIQVLLHCSRWYMASISVWHKGRIFFSQKLMMCIIFVIPNNLLTCLDNYSQKEIGEEFSSAPDDSQLVMWNYLYFIRHLQIGYCLSLCSPIFCRIGQYSGTVNFFQLDSIAILLFVFPGVTLFYYLLCAGGIFSSP